jgi:cysteinyl-tRNA synthetase
VLNFTDVEDKAVDQARKKGVDIKEMTEQVAKKFSKELKVLRIKPPTHNPRSSESVDQAVLLIKKLLERGVAYWHEGDVYFDPLKFKGFGRLYGLDMSLWPKQKRRFKKDTYPGMRWNMGDFILWHGCKEGESVCWDQDLGSGRPSWNVQDPAMATKFLGFKIDICCGGVDNLFRHHDYNIAVVEGVSGEEFAPFWLHGEHLFAYGKKMSKSTGNVIYLDDLLKNGNSPEHVRFFLIYGHYRGRLNFTQLQFQKSNERLDEFKSMVEQLNNINSKKNGEKGAKSDRLGILIVKDMVRSFEECLNNDLDITCAFDDLYESIGKLVSLKEDGKLNENDSKNAINHLKKIDEILQIIF